MPTINTLAYFAPLSAVNKCVNVNDRSQCNKTFLSSLMKRPNKLEFVLGKLFELRLTLVGKAREHLNGVSLR
jgi:hypothetical protein